MKPTLSIIIPVYNAEKYLDYCLESITAQSFKDWECILVNDGSVDSSGRICDKWASLDSRFKVIHKENGGQSSARNLALVNSNGRYTMFVDADDSLTGAALVAQLILEMEEDSSLDFVQFALKAFDEKGNLEFERKPQNNITIKGQRDILSAFCKGLIYVYVCGKVFRSTSLRSKVKFIEGVYYEDPRFLMDLLPSLQKVLLTNIGYYRYNLHSSSTTQQKFSLRHAKDLFKKDFHGVLFSSQFPYLKDAYLAYYSSALTEYINVQLISSEQELYEYNKQLREVAPSFRQLYKSDCLSLSKKLTITIVKLFGISVLNHIVEFKKKCTSKNNINKN